MFQISQAKGFQITFANGLLVSVQFGSGNYCENLRRANLDCLNNTPVRLYEQGYFKPAPPSRDAEVAVIDTTTDTWAKVGRNDEVVGYRTPEQVASILALAAEASSIDVFMQRYSEMFADTFV